MKSAGGFMRLQYTNERVRGAEKEETIKRHSHLKMGLLCLHHGSPSIFMSSVSLTLGEYSWEGKACLTEVIIRQHFVYLFVDMALLDVCVYPVLA